jgi:hypothetical protein
MLGRLDQKPFWKTCDPAFSVPEDVPFVLVVFSASQAGAQAAASTSAV